MSERVATMGIGEFVRRVERLLRGCGGLSEHTGYSLSPSMEEAVVLLRESLAIAAEVYESRKAEQALIAKERERAEKAEAERDAAIRERDLAIAHDRQPYPTAEAYKRVCKALEKQRGRTEKAHAVISQLLMISDAQNALLSAYRLGTQPPVWALDTMAERERVMADAKALLTGMAE